MKGMLLALQSTYHTFAFLLGRTASTGLAAQPPRGWRSATQGRGVLLPACAWGRPLLLRVHARLLAFCSAHRRACTRMHLHVPFPKRRNLCVSSHDVRMPTSLGMGWMGALHNSYPALDLSQHVRPSTYEVLAGGLRAAILDFCRQNPESPAAQPHVLPPGRIPCARHLKCSRMAISGFSGPNTKTYS